ncbi:MAG TPA: hypothetical protein VGF45_15535 [Polyangia bacterium]
MAAARFADGNRSVERAGDEAVGCALRHINRLIGGGVEATREVIVHRIDGGWGARLEEDRIGRRRIQAVGGRVPRVVVSRFRTPEAGKEWGRRYQDPEGRGCHRHNESLRRRHIDK